jgi:hypothetical protein
MTRFPYPPSDDTWPPELTRLVLAVRAPALPGELAGEDAAADLFRATRDAAPPRRTLHRVLAVKVFAGAAVLLAGGYAVAAATGAVPGPSFAPAPAVTTPGGGSPGDGSPGGTTPGPQGTLDERGPGLAPGADPTRRPAESYVGLCEAYFHTSADHGTRPMRDLVAAAGGVEGVPGFCAAVGVPSPTPPAAEPKPPKTAKPTPTRPTPTKPEKSSGPPPDRTPQSPSGGGPGSSAGARTA